MRLLTLHIAEEMAGRKVGHLLRGELGLSSSLVKSLKWRENAILLCRFSYRRNREPSFLPSRMPAAISVDARKNIAHTPNAEAIYGPFPR